MSSQSETRLPLPAVITVGGLVLIALALRFTGLDSKFFWGDETHTALATAGSTLEDVRETIYDGRPHSRGQVMAHQFPRPDRGALDTIHALAVDDPKHPPMFYLSARAWMLLTSPSIAGLRSWSATLSMIAIAAVSLLARELTGSSLAGLTAAGLLAVSPLHLIYAQEGREYMCWVVFVLLSSWLLVGALHRSRDGDRRGRRWFALYALALAAAWYSHTLTIFVVAAHACFVVVAEGPRWTPVVRRTAVAIAAAALLYAPWAVVIFNDPQEHPAWDPWQVSPISWGEWLRRIFGGYSNAFMDLDSSWLLPRDQMLAVVPLLVAAWAVWSMLRSEPRRTRWFLVSLGLACTLPFVVTDLATHNHRATIIRYQFPAVLALQVSVAIGIANALEGSAKRRIAGLLAAATFVATGWISAYQYKAAGPIWWNKISARSLVPAAAIINRAEAPLVVSSEPFHNLYKMFAMSHPLGDHVRILMVERHRFPDLPETQREVYLWNVRPGEVEEFGRRGWRVDMPGPPNLYHVYR